MSQRFVQPPGIAPGQWSGSFAAGVSPRDRGAIKIEPVQRVGEKTAKEFPWMASIFARMPITLGAGGTAWSAVGSRLRFTRPGGEQSFYNNTNRPIKIDEIRIYAIPAPAVPTGVIFQIGRQVGLRLYDKHKEYIRGYLPLWQFQTETNRIAESMRLRGSFKLPASYYLDKANSFQLRTRVWWGINPADVTPNVNYFLRSTNLDYAFGLQGQREGSNYPAKLMRQVVVPTLGATPVNPLFSVIPFNENRDNPMTDVEVSHIGIGMRDIVSTLQVVDSAMGWPWLCWTQLQFVPPQGPKWMSSEDWIPIWGLLDQPGPLYQATSLSVAGYAGWDHSMIIHRPITPYILQPREELSVELETLIQMDYTASNTNTTPGWTEYGQGIPFWCTMYGRQESLA